MRAVLAIVIGSAVACQPRAPQPEDGCKAVADNVARALECPWAGTPAEIEAVCRNAFYVGLRYPVACLRKAGSCAAAEVCQ